MSSCSNPELQNFILLYLEGELSGEKKDEMAVHLGSCVFCIEEVQALKGGLNLAALNLCSAIDSALQWDDKLKAGRTQKEKIPDWFKAGVRAAFKKERHYFFLLPGFAMAFCTVLGFLFFYSGYLYNLNQLNVPLGIRVMTKRVRIKPKLQQSQFKAHEKRAAAGVPQTTGNLSLNTQPALETEKQKVSVRRENSALKNRTAQIENEKSVTYSEASRKNAIDSETTEQGFRNHYRASEEPQFRVKHFMITTPKPFSFIGFFLMIASIPLFCLAGLSAYRFFHERIE
jgi:hypothetical protein